VRDLPNLSKRGRMFGWFSHLVNSYFASIHPCVWIKISPILSCNVFHFHDFWRYFWPDFRSHDLRSLSSIPSVGLGDRKSPFDLVDFSRFPQNLDFFSSSKIGREIFGFGKNLFGNCSLC
jgi:hypothetical protein